MGTPFLAQLQIVSYNFAPKGWALCNGQLLPINQNQALFSLLGTTFGGNGQTTFALPNVQSRLPVHMGGSYTLGATGGAESATFAATGFAVPSTANFTPASVPRAPTVPGATLSPFLALNFIIALQGIFPAHP